MNSKFCFLLRFLNALKIMINLNSCQSKAFMFLSLPQITSPMHRKQKFNKGK